MTNETISKTDSENMQADLGEQDIDWSRILVACQVGRTGKSTIADSVLASGLGGEIFSVESLNQDASQYGARVRVYRADDMRKLRTDMSLADHPVIVDLGSSDFALFVEKMGKANLFMDFTHCVIVTDPTQRGQEEAITTYETLRALGIENSQFRIVLNKARTVITLEAQFDILFGHAATDPGFPLNPACWLPEHDLFAGLHESGQGYREVLEDNTDYKPLIRKALKDGNREVSQDYALRQINQRMAMGMQTEFDRCFEALAIPVGQ
ncbi:hypothetical protein P0D88_40315 [Paraburkholderia sp. RL18-103-BIB-C]|uniref:hypothetical protein n=1 Tax=Paraburkholderia sp. RL18-103-BIB-C TaxID=3031637 RepID=UPI0038B84A16